MKGRPRRIEREAATRLSLFFSDINLPKVERVPVIGRTGPDIQVNEFGLVVDVKSRKKVPKGILVGSGEIKFITGVPFDTETKAHHMVGVRLGEINLLVSEEDVPRSARKGFVSVSRWMMHMDKWTKKHQPDGITALILHRSGTYVDHSTFLVFEKDLEVFNDRYKRFSRND